MEPVRKTKEEYHRDYNRNYYRNNLGRELIPNKGRPLLGQELTEEERKERKRARDREYQRLRRERMKEGNQ